MNAISDHAQIRAAHVAGLAFLLETEGYCIVRGVLPRCTIESLDVELDRDFRETPYCSGGFYGERTKRFGRLLARSPSMADLVLAPDILAMVRRILSPWCDTIQLNVAQAIEIHPGALSQFPHRDQDMWPDAAGGHEYLVNVMWPLTAFTAENGATRIWPGSHGADALNPAAVEGETIAAQGEPGDAILFLGSTLHAAGANLTSRPRRGIVIGYSLGWLKPYENPWLAYPPEVARGFPSALAALAGYRQHRPNLGNYEGQCPSVLLDEQAPGRLAATDALTPEQADALADYVARQYQERDAGPMAAAPPS